MKILLIHPLHEKRGGVEKQKRQRKKDDRVVSFPLGIAYIAGALMREGHDVQTWDIHAENLFWNEVESALVKFKFDAIGISAISSQYLYVKLLSGLIKKKRNVPIVVGGPLATHSAKLLLEHSEVDYCVIGEGEVTVPDLFMHLSDPQNVPGIAYKDGTGRIVLNAPREYIKDLGSLPMPAYECFNMDYYVTRSTKMTSTRTDGETAIKKLRTLRTGYIITGRGCPFHCRFCSRNYQGVRIIPVEKIMDEILHLRDSYGVEFIHFGDELLTLNKRRTIEICEAMKDTGLLWDCQSRVNIIDKEILAAMRNAGCVTVGFGIESGSQRMLDAMKKGITVAQIEQAMKAAMELDFDIKVQLMFGFPGEDMDSLQETMDLFKRLNHPARRMTFFTVLPGTDIYDRCVADGTIKDEDEYLGSLAEGAGFGRVLKNFSAFKDEEIYPRMNWAKYTMRANATDDPVLKKKLLRKAETALTVTTGSGIKTSSFFYGLSMKIKDLLKRRFPTFEERLLKNLRTGSEKIRPLITARAHEDFHKILKRQMVRRPWQLTAKDIYFLFKKNTVIKHVEEMSRQSSTWEERLKAVKERGTGKPLLAIVVPDGQSVRTFLLTDIWRHLNEWADIVLLTPYNIEEYGSLNGRPAKSILPLSSLPKMPIDTLLRFAHYRNSESPTHRIFVKNIEKSYREKNDKMKRLWKMSARFGRKKRYHRLYEFTMMAYGALSPLNEACDLLMRLRPDMVLNTNAINFSAKLWMRAAALSGVPTASFVTSWDNISSKWLIDEFAGTYLLWSEEMKNDFRTCFPDFSSKRLLITGSPQFEPIINKTGLLPKEEFFKRHGLRPGVPLVLYTTGSKTTFPAEPECLIELLDRWKKRYHNTMQFMIRMHPKDRHHRYRKVRKMFPEVSFTLAGENLTSDDEWLPNKNDLELFVNQMNHCDVCINVASTMTLEGFAADKPCVNIGFDLGKIDSIHYPLKDYYNSRHYRDVISSGSVKLALDYDEVFRYTCEYLERPLTDETSRREIFLKKCTYPSDASERIDRAIRDIVKPQITHGHS